MAFQSIWYFTDLPEEIVNIVEKDLRINYDSDMEDSVVHGNNLNKNIRNSQNSWIPTTHWISGFLWHYVEKANRENFLYDLTMIDGESLQYTQYGPGQFYNWHQDAGISGLINPQASSNRDIDKLGHDFISQNIETTRKLSFSIQLSDPSDYEGGNFQLLDEQNKMYVAPRQRGALILFDSRSSHRVTKVTKGIRKSIVGWVVGPRWR